MTLSSRLVLVCVALVLATVAGVLYPIQRGLEARLVPAALLRLSDETDRRASELEAYLGLSEADVRTLQGAPAVAAIMGAEAHGGSDPLTGVTEERARDALGRLFAAFMKAHPRVLQARLVGLADGGREIVRVDRGVAGGPLRMVADADLQQKGDRDYFQTIVALPAGAIGVTRIELNREFGEIEVPHVPVTRVGMPVERADGSRYGILILNYDMRPLFDELVKAAGREAALYVVNDQGDYLVHPDESRVFGFDLGRRFRVADDFPGIAPTLTEDRQQSGFLRPASGDEVAFAISAVSGPDGGRLAHVIETMPKSAVYASVDAAQRSSLAIAGIASLIAIAVAILVARSLARPIRQTAEAVAVGGDEIAAGLPAGGPPEVRVLANAIRSFVDIERLYRSALTSADAVITVLALDGTVLSWNRAAEKVYGYSATEMIGRSLDVVIPEELRAAEHDKLCRIARDERVELYDTERVTRDGTRIVMAVAISPVHDAGGTVVGITKISRDVTEQRRLQEMFRLTVDASPAGMLVVDSNGIIVLANIAAEAMFGYGSAELIGQSVEILVPQVAQSQHVGDRSAFLADPQQRAMGAGRDLRARRRDGSEFPVEVGLSPFVTREGVRVLAVIVDVTERKRAEAELQAQKQELERSNAELAQFAYVASHDLQEPLRMVSSFCDLLKRKYGDILEGDGLEYIDFAVDGAQRMQQLITELLAYSRLNTRPTQPERVAVGRILDVVQRDLAVSMAETGATIEYGDMPEVMCDPTRCRQLFQNLISNAIRFHGDEPPLVRIEATRSGDFWRFSVRDNGIGIDYEQRERIFGVFQRLHTRDEYPGTGIGLAACKRIVENAGGAIWLEAQDGPGATFSFTLPSTAGVSDDLGA